MQTLANELPLPKLWQGEPPWEHQLRGYHLARNIFNRYGSRKWGAGCGLYFDMGTGKTRSAIFLLDNTEAVGKVLIVAPKKVVENEVWPNEFKKWSARSDRLVLTPTMKGTVKKRAMQIAEVIEDFPLQAKYKQVVVVMNYDAVWREPMATVLKHCHFHMCILDEAHRIKSVGSAVSRYMGKLGKKIPYRLALTGTPLPHSPLDAWPLYRYLDSTVFPDFRCWNFKEKRAECPPGNPRCCFKKTYAEFGGFENRQVIEWKNQDELGKKMYSIAMRVKKEDVLDLPELMHIDRRFTLTPKTKRIYNELDEELFTHVDEGKITAANVLVKLIRIQQVTSGHSKLDDGTVVELNTEKEEELEDLLDGFELREPVVIFYRFTEDAKAIARVCDKQERRFAQIGAGKNELEPWNKGEADILAVQIQAGGEGLDMTRAAYAVYYSLGFSLAEYDQSLSRLHRHGQTKPVTCYHLCARDTIDTRIYRALDKRREIVEYVLTRAA